MTYDVLFQQISVLDDYYNDDDDDGRKKNIIF